MISIRSARPIGRLAAWLAILALLVGAARPLVVQALSIGAPDFARVLCSTAGTVKPAGNIPGDAGAPAAAAHGHGLCCLLSCVPAALPVLASMPLASPAAWRLAVPDPAAAPHLPAPWTRAPSRGPPIVA